MEPNENAPNIKVSTESLLKYALPTILSNVFMNVYSIVDQLFVSNLLGTAALSAVSIAGPFLAIALSIGTMIATGGCALASNQMGDGKAQKARQNFSFLMLFSVFISTVFCVLGIAFRTPTLYAMGADASLYSLCEAYAIPIFLLIPFAMVSIVLQIFFVAAGRPGLGFGLSVAGGLTNIVLDYVLIAVIPLGVAGAAYATAAGYVLQSVIGVIFFFADRKGSLYFVRPKFDGKALLKACSNGMSEMVGMLAVTVTMIAINIILMNLAGSDSAENFIELKALYRVALKTVAAMSVVTFIIAFPLAKPIAHLFADGSETVVNTAVRGMFIFAAAFLLMGFNLFASGFFTALNDGKTSAVLSLFRTLIFLIIPLLILPKLWGVDGVWIAMPAVRLYKLSAFRFT